MIPCKMCTSAPVAHKVRIMCTSCYSQYRKRKWRVNYLKRLEDPSYRQKLLAKKKTTRKSANYNTKRCRHCESDALKGSRKMLCRSCSIKDRAVQKSLYQMARKKQHLPTRIRENIKSRVNRAIRNYKLDTTIKELGCSVEELMRYLEARFKPGMSWSNYGLFGWHIDHIVPISSFDLSDPEQLRQACHYTNLQPLWAKDNLKKSDKYE
jgi:hypothetical protein